MKIPAPGKSSGRGEKALFPKETQLPSIAPKHRNSGVALIIVLGMLVLLSIIVVAFLTSVTTDLGDSKAYESQINTRILADSAVNLVIGEIRAASTQSGTAWISQPGLIRTFNKTGGAVAAYKLYSSGNMIDKSGTFDPAAGTDLPSGTAWLNQPNLWTDMNSPVTTSANGSAAEVFPIIDGNGMSQVTVTSGTTGTAITYVSGSSGTIPIPTVEGFNVDPTQVGVTFSAGTQPSGTYNPVPMPVQWLYMLKDGTLLSAAAASATGKDVVINDPGNALASGTNPIVARIAFWTDDESCKVDINTASEGTFEDTPVGNTQPPTPDAGDPDPQGSSNFDPNQIFEWDLAQRAPDKNEYSRYPGHPATTCLSPVLGAAVMNGLNLSGTGTTGVGYHTLTGTSWAQFVEFFTQLAPRVSDYDLSGTLGNDVSSKGGSQRAGGPSLYSSGTSATIGTGTAITIDSDRLYGTVDDMFYNPSRLSNGGVLSGGTTILTSSLLEKTKFFLTANSKSPETNLFNMPRVCIWPITKSSAAGLDDPTDTGKMTSYDKLIAFCASVGGTTSGSNPVPFYFTRFDPFSQTVDYSGINNAALYAYLHLFGFTQQFPGFSGSATATFAKKYATEDVSNNNQILTEIFDYIRCTNLADVSQDAVTGSGSSAITTHSNSYTQTSTMSFLNPSWMGQTQQGQVVPITIGTTRGIGRIITIGEMALVMVKEDNRINPNDRDDTLEKSITVTGPKYAGTYTFSGSGVPNSQNVLLAGSSNYAGTAPTNTSDYLLLPGIGGLPGNTYDPRTQTRIQFALVPYLFSPMCGYSALANDVQIKFTSININVKENVSGSSIFTNTGTQSSLYDTGRLDVINQGESKTGGPIGCKTFVETSRGGVPSNVGSPSDSVFPTGECVVTGTSGPVVGGTWTGGTMTISGTAQVEIWSPAPSGTTPNGDTPTKIQSFTFVWPSQVVPIPALSLSGTTYNYYGAFTNTTGATNTYSGNNPNTAPPMASTGTNVKSGNSRLTNWNNYETKILAGGSPNQNGGPQNSGDVIRSIPLSGTLTSGTGIQGDFRLVAATSAVPQGWYAPLQTVPSGPTKGTTTYYDQTKPRSYGFKSFIGDITWQDPTLGFLIENLNNSTSPHPPWNAQNTNPTYLSPGNTNWQSYVPEGVSGVYNYLGSPGDWDNGPGLMVDGAYCNKADEGTIRHYETGQDFVPSSIPPYIGHGYCMEDGGLQLPTLFSPNRQISSPVMFGSLPTGVLAQHPWQTLLFHPAKPYFPGGVQHPGAGVPTTAAITSGSGSVFYPPYSTLPDHLLLDMFWMPVVEPYPISEPFATAGKINLNFQIAPFTYIRRQTAMRAVLQSVKITALNPTEKDNTGAYLSTGYKQGGSYKNTGGAGDGGGVGISVRRNIDLDSTLNQIEQLRFGTQSNPVNKPFISASEICDIPLIPQDRPAGNGTPYNISASGTVAASGYDALLYNFWWGDPTNTSNNQAPAIPQFGHRLTGDNSLERPYSMIYPRLTTKSNIYTVHVRVQTLKKASSTSFNVFKDGQDQVTGEFRGSFVIERYLDPANSGFYTSTGATTNMKTIVAQLGPYKFRILNSKQFAP